jgi:hypothetical protein
VNGPAWDQGALFAKPMSDHSPASNAIENWSAASAIFHSFVPMAMAFVQHAKIQSPFANAASVRFALRIVAAARHTTWSAAAVSFRRHPDCNAEKRRRSKSFKISSQC